MPKDGRSKSACPWLHRSQNLIEKSYERPPLVNWRAADGSEGLFVHRDLPGFYAHIGGWRWGISCAGGQEHKRAIVRTDKGDFRRGIRRAGDDAPAGRGADAK